MPNSDAIAIADAARAALPLFRLNDWRYGERADYNVPTEERICALLESLVAYVDEGKPERTSVRTGRFLVTSLWNGDIAIAVEVGMIHRE